MVSCQQSHVQYSMCILPFLKLTFPVLLTHFIQTIFYLIFLNVNTIIITSSANLFKTLTFKSIYLTCWSLYTPSPLLLGEFAFFEHKADITTTRRNFFYKVNFDTLKVREKYINSHIDRGYLAPSNYVAYEKSQFYWNYCIHFKVRIFKYMCCLWVFSL